LNNTKISFLFATLLLLFACNRNAPEGVAEVIIPIDTERNVDYETSLVIKHYFENIDTSKTATICNDSVFSVALMYNFYQKNNFKNIWVRDFSANPLLDSMLQLISIAPEYGLKPNEYHYYTIDSLLKSIQKQSKQYINIGNMAKADLLLTDAFFSLAIHVQKGRLNKDSLHREWKGGSADSALVNKLYIALEKGNIKPVIDSLEPKENEYRNLKYALKNFRTEFANNNWDSLFHESDDSSIFQERLISRLKASHDYFDEYSGTPDEKLITAIKNFQCKHHLIEDGKIGKLTYKALKKNKQDYINQIEINMERWRLYDKPAAKQYVWINIPKFEMEFFENDSLIMNSTVIVGSPEHPTPILQSTIRYFLIYPYWNVPYKIATKEILPILKRMPYYLNRKNMEVLNRKNEVVNTPINWKKYNEDYFPFKLRQRIGDDNALGILKFYFNNKYGVYMHDTDNKSLFNLENRALSHGCIRLEKIIDFALYLIKNDSLHYSSNDLKNDLLQEKQKYVYIRKPIPIYTAYFTAETQHNGQLLFFDDIYGYDTKMVTNILFYNKN
jgi:murein L,D-transpeptidase YcbB/YkuD